jgi:hypothetical protein
MGFERIVMSASHISRSQRHAVPTTLEQVANVQFVFLQVARKAIFAFAPVLHAIPEE